MSVVILNPIAISIIFGGVLTLPNPSQVAESVQNGEPECILRF
jgi:hypothetical protein